MSETDDELDRKAILARRRRFMAVALTGLAGTTLAATACPCLKVGPPPDEPGPDTSPAPSTDGTNETEGATESDGESEDDGAERVDRRQDDGDSLEEAQPVV